MSRAQRDSALGRATMVSGRATMASAGARMSSTRATMASARATKASARARMASALAGALLLASSAAHAQGAPQPSGDDVGRAKTYFNAGAQAYAAGQFPAAVQAFEEAYKLAPRPAILFSIAQAHRRQYYLDKNPERLSLAVKFYRQYVDVVPQGGRRADAAEALAELEPLAARVAGSAPAAASPVETKAQTRLMVSSSTKDAEVALDGAGKGELPLIADVTPGRHTIRVTGPGYVDEERDVLAAEGGLVALDVSLRERPARLTVVAMDGAAVAIDGRLTGTTPLPSALELPAGSHLVTVTKSGHKPVSRVVEVERGEARTMDAPLEITGQRVASYVLLAGSAGGLVAGGVFAGIAMGKQAKAEDVLDAQAQHTIELQRLSAYDAARTARDDWKRAASVAFGGALGVGAVGLLLYAFDQPSIEAPAGAVGEKPRPLPEKKKGDEPMEMSGVPVWTGDLVGVSIAGRF